MINARSPVLMLLACGAFAPPTAAQLASPEPEWYLPTGDGCRLFVQEYGSGRDTVVVLHGGWGAEHGYLIDAFRGLEERYHLVFYDQRGSLRSPCPDSLISVAAHVRDLDLLRNELQRSRVTLAAHSMGTYLAMEYLNRHPDRVKGLVLMGALVPKKPMPMAADSTAGEPDDLGRSFLQRPAIAEELRKHGLDRDTSQLSAEQETSAWRIRFAGVNLYHVDRWRELKGGQVFYSASAGNAAARTMRERYDFVPDIARHPCRVTVVIGDHDYVDLGARQHRRWSEGVVNVELNVIGEAGHAGWIDAPRAYRRALGAGLDAAARCE